MVTKYSYKSSRITTMHNFYDIIIFLIQNRCKIKNTIPYLHIQQPRTSCA